MIYLDNAATTFPKAPDTLERAVERYRELGVSPGRGNHDLAMRASDAVDEVRAKVAAFFGAPDPERVAFGANATDALNTAILGLVRPGDHVVATRLDHNSVLRPLHHLAETGRHRLGRGAVRRAGDRDARCRRGAAPARPRGSSS